MGAAAEVAVADWLEKSGYHVIDRNWKTRWCEIDIVVMQAETVYFIEVKYRRSASAGDGLDAITPRKRLQLHRAARLWLQAHQSTVNYRLIVVAVTGQFKIVAIRPLS